MTARSIQTGWSRIFIVTSITLILLSACVSHFDALRIPFSVSSANSKPIVEPLTKPRKTIGLALSGGGARGFAHAGILQWFDEHRIPVDYVAGTSMGGLVGGMYSLGMTGCEIMNFLASKDWEMLLRGNSSFQNRSFRRKEDRMQIPGAFTIGFKPRRSDNAGGTQKHTKKLVGKPQLASGVNSGMEVGFEFDRLALPYDPSGSFDSLPIPFRCVAASLKTGREVVLAEGSLSRALRATMSVPGLFTPVDSSGDILIDGGVLNNLPTDVVRSMGADVVIAIDISSPLEGINRLDGLLAVLNQTITVATRANVDRNARLATLCIKPQLDGYGFDDFDKSCEIAELGYKSLQDNDKLLEYQLSESEWQDHLRERNARIRVAPDNVRDVVVKKADERTRNDMSKKLNRVLESELDQKLIQQELRKTAGQGRYDSFDYRLGKQDQRTMLVITAQEKTYGPPFLYIGPVLNNSSTDDAEINLAGRFTFHDFGRSRAEWRTDFSLGTQPMLASEYFRPLSDTNFFVAPHAAISARQRNVFAGPNKIGEYELRDSAIGLDAGYALSERSQFRLGYSVGYRDARRTVGNSEIQEFEGPHNVATFSWSYLGQNSEWYSTEGLVIKGATNVFLKTPGAERTFSQAEVSTSYARPVSQAGTLVLAGSGGTTFGTTAPILQKFALGGLFRLGGYGNGELTGDNYIFGEIGYLHRIAKLPPFLGNKVLAGVWYDGGSVFDSRKTASYSTSGTAGILIETRLFPTFLGASWAEGGRGKFYFAIGRIF